MLKRTASTLAKTLLWFAVVMLVLVAVVVGLARQLVSDIHNLQPQTAEFLSRQTGFVIEFDDLQGSWKGLAPRFQLRNFRVRQAADLPPAILVRHLDLEILLLRSVANLAPRVRLNLDGALLTLAQSEGRMVIEGLDTGAPKADAAPGQANAIGDLISAQPRINLTDSRIIVKGWHDDPVVLNLKQLKAEAGRVNRYLAGDVILQGPTQLAFQLRAKLRGSFFVADSLNGDIYLDAAQADWLPWIPEAKRQFKQVQLTGLQGGNETWLRFRDSQLVDATSRFIVHRFNLDSDNEIQPPQIKRLSGVARWQRLDNGGWQAGIEDFQMVTSRFNWQPSVLSIAATPDSDGGVQYGLALDDAEITPWLNYFLSTQPETGKLYDTLKALRPAGKLQRLVLFMQHRDNLLTDLRVLARIEQFNSRAWEKYPGFRDLDLELWGRKGAFIIRLDDDYLELNYPDLFRDTLVLKHIDGILQLQQQEDGFLLQSGPLHLNTDDVRTATQFSLHLPADKAQPPFMQLQATLRDVQAAKKSLYLPAGVIPPKLLTWLDESILAGRLVRGDILVHGNLGKDQIPNRRILLGFSVANADLRFLPDWEEPVRHADADVIVDRGGVWASIVKGEYFGQTLTSGQVTMPRVPQGEQHILHVNVTTQGPAQQGFPILQVTPLGERTGEAVKDMQLAGDMAVKFDLAVPLDKGEQKTRASADVTLRNGQFRLQSRNLQIDAVSADVHFDLENGLSSPAITGKALGGDISGTIDTQPLQQGGQITALNFSGTAQIAALQDWLKLSVLEPLSGTAPYQMEMQIPLGDARQHKHGFINVTSTLQGARVDLPEPFAKTAQRKRDMRVWLSLDRNPSLMSVRYGKLFELSVQSKDGEWQKGNLSLGDQKAVLPVENHFAVTGSVERFSTTEWMAVLSRVQGSAQRYQEPLKSNKLVLLDQSRLDIGEFVLGQTSLGRQQLSLQRQGHNWLVQTAGDAIDGSALLPAYIFADANLFPRQAVPVDVQIDRITWPRVEEETKTETTPEATPETIPAADDWQPVDISPRVLPPLDVTIRRLQWGDGDFGDWALKLRPVSDGMRLRDVRFQMRGVEFSGEGSWREQGGNRSSQLKGQYSSNSIANVMRAWGSEPTMDSKTLNGKLDIQWPGAPFEFAVSRSRGSLDLKMTDGTFYNVKSGVVGKFWGALNFETLLRRLQLNFKDLQEKDMVYDEIKANARIHDGVLAVQDLQLESPAIKLQTNGNVDLNNSQLDMVMKVTVPVTRNLVLPAAAIGGVPAAAAVWAVEKVLGSQFDKLTTIQYSVKGGFDEPKVEIIDSFNIIPDKVSETVLSPDKKADTSSGSKP